MYRPDALTPRLPAEPGTESIDHFMHRAKGYRGRAEIDSTGRRCWRFHQRSCRREVAGQRFEHMLPGSHGIRIAQRHRHASLERPHAIGNEPIGGPVASANDVAGSHRCDWRSRLKETVAKAVGEEFGAGFTVAVGVVAAEAVSLDERAAQPM